MSDEDFFKYVANIRCRAKTKPPREWRLERRTMVRVFYADPIALRMLRKFNELTSDTYYETKFRFVRGEGKRYNIFLMCNKTYNIFEKNVEVPECDKPKILKEFFDRFYNIDVERLLQNVIGFPPTRSLPAKLKLSPMQTNLFLSTLQREIIKGKTDKKIVTVSHAKLIKEYKIIDANELRSFLEEMFTLKEKCQIFLDYKDFATNQIELINKRKKEREEAQNNKDNKKSEVDNGTNS